MKKLIWIALGLIAANAWADQNLSDEMDALGANKAIMLKAQAIDPDNRVRIVQNRQVDLYNRLELTLNYGAFASGNDPYVNTTQIGGQIDYHLTPRWSLGLRYSGYQNSLNSEGQSVLNDANQRIANGQSGVRVPVYSWARDSYMAVVDWYPIYGKLNLFDSAVSQFDLYLLGGGGTIDLAYTSSMVLTAGGGLAVWISKHFSTRLEARYQNYTDRLPDGAGGSINRGMNEMVLQAGVGFLL